MPTPAPVESAEAVPVERAEAARVEKAGAARQALAETRHPGPAERAEIPVPMLEVAAALVAKPARPAVPAAAA